MPYRVFVSSTSVDLEAHRRAVADGIRELGAVDVSMEHLGARDERPKDESLRLVRKESDFFVGIYAHRYGFIPEGDELSITEAEYNEASSAGLLRLIYLVDETAPWSPPHIDTGEAAERLARFKRKLRLTHIFKEFSSADSLRAFVSADLGREILRKVLARVSPDETSNAGQVSISPDPKSIDEWDQYREGVYKEHQDIFLVHSLTPSQIPGQLFDVFIYLARHPSGRYSSDLSHIDHAEFFLGPYWNDQVFRVQNEGGRIGILASAYGTFLCTCRVTFKDGNQVRTSRYIDFESASVNRAE
jgi:hypothetical protein